MRKHKDYDSCPGYETSPNVCRCPCEGCKHNCGAHEEEPLKRGRAWFYRPYLYWDWAPIRRGHDEFARNTIVIGWPFTGRIIIALGFCGEQECIVMRDKMLEELGEAPW